MITYDMDLLIYPGTIHSKVGYNVAVQTIKPNLLAT